MNRFQKLENYLVYVVLGTIVIVYTILLFLSEGTHGGADDVNHYQLARYAFQHPEFFLNQWGKPFFTAIISPFAQLGFNGVRIFNVLAGTLAAYLTYRVALQLKLGMPALTIFLLISSPLYTVLMISGMTEILFSLMLILNIFLFYRGKYIWSAILLSFIPFVRTEGAVIIPLFFLAYAWRRQWKAIPFLITGFAFYSIAGSFHHNDLLWLIRSAAYSGDAKDIYGSGELLHYVKARKLIFGTPSALLIILGLITWLVKPVLKKGTDREEWLMEMLVVYLPFLAYFAAHSYVWWKGIGNSVGMIRVIVAVLPSAVLMGTLGWSSLMELIPVRNLFKYVATGILAAFLVTIPYRIFRIPVQLEGTQRIVKDASDWMLQSDFAGKKIYYFNPFFPHFLKVNPYDHEQAGWFVPDREHPENGIREGEIVIWDAHFGPNEGRLPLERLMDNEGFRLVHLTRDKEPFTVLGGYLYEIYFFQRITNEKGISEKGHFSGEGSTSNHEIYREMLESILNSDLQTYQSSDHIY